MLVVKLTITWPDGSSEDDFASGNTPRMAQAAAASLGRSYELDGATVTVHKGTHKV